MQTIKFLYHHKFLEYYMFLPRHKSKVQFFLNYCTDRAMIYLTYNNVGGRSGHKLKNILSTFIISFFVKDSICVYHPSWDKQYILNNINIPHVNSIKYDKIIKIKNITAWKGIGYNKFLKLITNINNYQSINKNILIQISSRACRIHPHILHNWFINKIIPENYCETKFIPLIKSFYYKNTIPSVLNIISIHIRRGDLAKMQIANGFNVEYYRNIINILNKYHNIPIHIYSENYNSNDLHKLEPLKNVKLFLGGVNEITSDFRSMVRSKILFLSSCSFSTWSGYLSLGKVYYHYRKIKQFSHIIDLNNFYRYNKLTMLNNIMNNQYANNKVPLPP